MSKINVKFLTDEALATIKANLDKFTKIEIGRAHV